MGTLANSEDSDEMPHNGHNIHLHVLVPVHLNGHNIQLHVLVPGHLNGYNIHIHVLVPQKVFLFQRTDNAQRTKLGLWFVIVVFPDHTHLLFLLC